MNKVESKTRRRLTFPVNSTSSSVKETGMEAQWSTGQLHHSLRRVKGRKVNMWEGKGGGEYVMVTYEMLYVQYLMCTSYKQ